MTLDGKVLRPPLIIPPMLLFAKNFACCYDTVRFIKFDADAILYREI